MRTPFEYARADMGLTEIKGAVDEPRIVQMFKDVGHGWVQDDETAWCAAAMGSWLKKAGLPHTGKLNARSYEEYGEPVEWSSLKPGDILVFTRGNSAWQGHVAFFVRHEGAGVIVLGGNQSNQVRESWYSRDRVIAARRPVGLKKPSLIATLIDLLTSLIKRKT